MNNKFFYLYLICGSIGIILLLYQLVTRHYTQLSVWSMVGDALLIVLPLYLAYKVYHEKKDREMM